MIQTRHKRIFPSSVSYFKWPLLSLSEHFLAVLCLPHASWPVALKSVLKDCPVILRMLNCRTSSTTHYSFSTADPNVWDFLIAKGILMGDKPNGGEFEELPFEFSGAVPKTSQQLVQHQKNLKKVCNDSHTSCIVDEESTIEETTAFQKWKKKTKRCF